MSQRAKAQSLCTAAGYAKGGMARPAKGPAKMHKPRAAKTPAPVAGPSQMPADMMGDPGAAAPMDPSAGLPQAPMRRGGMVKGKR